MSDEKHIATTKSSKSPSKKEPTSSSSKQVSEGTPVKDSSPSKDKKEKDKKKKNKRVADSETDLISSKKTKVEEETEEEKKKRKEEKKLNKKNKKQEQKVEIVNGGETSASTTTTTTTTASTKVTNDLTPTDPAAAREFLKNHSITIEAPEESNDKPPLPMIHFRELKGKIDESVRTTLDAQGFKEPTPIQACCWPVLLQGKDVVGIAETGSGKTFAFGLPALQHLVTVHKVWQKDKKKSKKAQVNVLVVAPTRELAIQTEENLSKLGNSLGIGMICLYGGVPKTPQIQALSNRSTLTNPIRIVVGTPGRVLDLAREGLLDLSEVSFLVLDEADRMLDKGFEPDIRAIIGMCKSREEARHTSMFSATWPPAVRGLAESFMNAPVRVTVGSDELSANRRVEQTVQVLSDRYDKERRLEQFLRKVGAASAAKNHDKILIFALYKKEAQRIETTLRRSGYKVGSIHGDLSQQDRIASLESFKSGETSLLVATDVAARGLDIPNVEHVVNYTFPLTIEDYVHRIGRTGRGGKTGKSLTYFTDEDKSHAGELIRVLKDAQQPVPAELAQFPTTIKKKTHSSYGDHFKELIPGKAKKITFDDDD